jgi:hypothetical protein
MSDKKETIESSVIFKQDRDELYQQLTSKASRLAADELLDALEEELNAGYSLDKAFKED